MTSLLLLSRMRPTRPDCLFDETHDMAVAPNGHGVGDCRARDRDYPGPLDSVVPGQSWALCMALMHRLCLPEDTTTAIKPSTPRLLQTPTAPATATGLSSQHSRLPRPEHQLPTPTPAPPSLLIAPPPPLRLCTSAPLRLCTPASSTTLSLCSFPNPHHALPDHPPTHHCRILPKSAQSNSFPYRPRKHTQLPAMSSPKRRIETDVGDPGRHFFWSTCA